MCYPTYAGKDDDENRRHFASLRARRPCVTATVFISGSENRVNIGPAAISMANWQERNAAEGMTTDPAPED